MRGTPPIRPRLPPIKERVGIDRDPPDLSDPADARWLLACVWPDTGRLDRTRAAIEFVKRNPVRLVRGDALALLDDVVRGLGPGGTVCVLTTWAFAYFLSDDRRRFIELLAEAGRRRLVVWIAGEGPGVVDLIEPAELPDYGDGEPSVLTAVSFDAHGRHPHRLGFAQPHGRWLDWHAPT